MLVVIIAGYGTHKTIRRASMKINQWAMEYYANFYGINQFKASTSLGDIGDL